MTAIQKKKEGFYVKLINGYGKNLESVEYEINDWISTHKSKVEVIDVEMISRGDSRIPWAIIKYKK